MPKNKQLTIPCVVIQQNSFQLVAFSMSAKKLWDLVQINQRDTDKDEGYQRALSLSRVNSVAKYIQAKNPIPNAILIAFEEKVSFLQESGFTHIVIPDKPNIAWVIDGQHRLAGARASNEDIELFVVAFTELNLKDQILQFVVINREAKGVPTSLYYDLLKQLPPSQSASDVAKERAADIATELRKDSSSVFFNRIVVASPRKGQISLTNWVRKLSPLVHPKNGKFNVYALKEQKLIFKNYFTALENVFPGEFEEKIMRFFSTLGFGAVLNALPTVFDLTLRDYKSFTVEDATRLLQTIEGFNFTNWDQLGTGSAAEIQAGEDLRQNIQQALENTGQTGTLRLT